MQGLTCLIKYHDVNRDLSLIIMNIMDIITTIWFLC